MSDINQVVLCGRVTRDAELRYTSGGTAVAEISVAVNRYAGKDKADEVSFIDCTVWGKQAESLKQYLTKGRQVVVHGELKQDRWEQDGQKRSKITVNVNQLQLVGGKDERAEQPKPEQRAEPVRNGVPNQQGPEHFDDSEIPF